MRSQAEMIEKPEVYFLKPNTCSPNSSLPVLIYRTVLPKPLSEASTTDVLTRNSWRKDGTWGHIGYRHFHPNVHECYGVFSGRSKMLLGQGQADEGGGIEVVVQAGDVIVLPAGTSHACLESSRSPDYQYIGVYPNNGPKWRSEFGRQPTSSRSIQEIEDVRLPSQDPIYGARGPMMDLWKLDVVAISNGS